jgi:hypothetical protein
MWQPRRPQVRETIRNAAVGRRPVPGLTSYAGAMEQTTYWFFPNGKVRMKPADGPSRLAEKKEVKAALWALPLTTFKPVRCERGR